MCYIVEIPFLKESNRHLNRWLRAHGINGNKALHVLRKEAGASKAWR